MNTKTITQWPSPFLARSLYHLHNSRASRIPQSKLAFLFPCWDKIPDVFVSLPVAMINIMTKPMQGKVFVLVHHSRFLSAIAGKSHGKSSRKLVISHPQLGAENIELMNASCSACFLLIYTIQDSNLEIGVTFVQARCFLMNQSIWDKCQHTGSQVSVSKWSQKQKSHHPCSETAQCVCAESREVAAANQLFAFLSWNSWSVLVGFC